MRCNVKRVANLSNDHHDNNQSATIEINLDHWIIPSKTKFDYVDCRSIAKHIRSTQSQLTHSICVWALLEVHNVDFFFCGLKVRRHFSLTDDLHVFFLSSFIVGSAFETIKHLTKNESKIFVGDSPTLLIIKSY